MKNAWRRVVLGMNGAKNDGRNGELRQQLSSGLLAQFVVHAVHSSRRLPVITAKAV